MHGFAVLTSKTAFIRAITSMYRVGAYVVAIETPTIRGRVFQNGRYQVLNGSLFTVNRKVMINHLMIFGYYSLKQF